MRPSAVVPVSHSSSTRAVTVTTSPFMKQRSPSSGLSPLAGKSAVARAVRKPPPTRRGATRGGTTFITTFSIVLFEMTSCGGGFRLVVGSVDSDDGSRVGDGPDNGSAVPAGPTGEIAREDAAILVEDGACTVMISASGRAALSGTSRSGNVCVGVTWDTFIGTGGSGDVCVGVT